MENIIRALEGRVLWYGRARDMLLGRAPMKKPFDWPLTGLPSTETERTVSCAMLCGAISELENTIAMLRSEEVTASLRRKK